ncbi:MAG: hypothetical protein IKO11_01835, partial [Lachnospiraceae bacterium]|nr:hypothetical protein [Lachnospiraceae bacterium]
YSIYNKGKTTLYNVQADFEGDSVEGGSTFIGKLDPGATGSVDAMLNAVAPTMDDGIVKTVISYEDEAGNVTKIEKDLQIFVYEMDYSEMGEEGWMDPGMTEIEEEGGGFPWGILFGGVALVIVAGIVTGILLGRSRKKKKLKAEQDALDDGIKDLDDEDDDEL